MAAGLETNWQMAKAYGLWGTRSPSGQRVRRGDDVFFWLSEVGWLAHCRVTSDAQPRHLVASVPWPEPKPFTFVFGIEVLSEPEAPVTMSGAHAVALAGLGSARSTIRLGQLPELAEAGVRAVAAVFPRVSDVERAMQELLSAAGIELPASDQRTFTTQLIAVRQGQHGFRSRLLTAFGGRCCITGTSIPQTLDAAHIRPYLGRASHVAGNGLLLRTDVHTLFDLHLLTVMPFGTVRTSPALVGSDYEYLDERQIARPVDAAFAPDRASLSEHNRECDWLQDVS